MSQRLFVYGSLRPGEANEHMLSGLQGQWTPGTVRGRLIASGWGATLGYPAIVLDEDAGSVRGFVFTSPDLSDRWDELDGFEGPEYERRRTTVRLDDGSLVEAHVYVLQG